MNTIVPRRDFLKTTATTATALILGARPGRSAAPAGNARSFSFVLLGDLHFDRLEHHDLDWVRKDKPNDVSQIENYTRITREITPRLLATVRETVADLNRSEATRVAFVLQVGDLVEGLCGSEERAVRQNREALDFVRGARLGAPFLFTKGNHDITGPGAVPAFGQVFLPFLSAEAEAVAPGTGAVKSARFTVRCAHSEFVFFDAYEAAASLEWYEAVVARSTAENLFVIVHPPVVPYGARSTWHLFSSARDKSRREKFLSLLGDQQAMVLGGHIHRYNRLVRSAGRGRFSQFALSSIISAPTVAPKMELRGDDQYTPDQIRVEPTFSPANEAERRAVYVEEKPFVRGFEYADLPGYAIVTVDGPQVTARMYSGIGRELWRTVELNPARSA